MARSYNDARSRTSWTEDRQSRRAIASKETRRDRKNEQRDIQRSMAGVTFGSHHEHYDEDGFEFRQ